MICAPNNCIVNNKKKNFTELEMNMSDVSKAFNVDWTIRERPLAVKIFLVYWFSQDAGNGRLCVVCVDCGRGECPLQILDIILPSA